MNHAMKHTTTSLAVFCLILTTLCPGRVYAEPPEDAASLETITAALQQWRDSLVNVQFTCTSTFEYSEQAAREEGLEGIVFRREYDWAWTDTGMQRRHMLDYRDGQLHHRSMRLVDGTTRYTVKFPDGASSVDAPSQVLKAPAEAHGKVVIEPLFGLWLPRTSQWLPELLSAGKAELLDPVIEEGVVYPQLRVTHSKAPDFYLYVILDPKRGFLPHSAYTGFGSGKKSRGQFRQTVTDFQQLEGGIWFPAAGEFHDLLDGEMWTKLRWEMTNVQVNQKISKKQFQPTLPAGTPIRNLVTGKTAFNGSRDKRRQVEGMRAAEAQENLANRIGGKGDVSARPTRGWSTWTRVGLLIFALALLVVAFKVRKRAG